MICIYIFKIINDYVEYTFLLILIKKMAEYLAELGVGTKKLPDKYDLVKSSNFGYDDQIAIEAAQVEGIDSFCRPNEDLSSGGPFTFIIEPTGAENYLQMNTMYLYAKCQITLPDGSDLTSEHDVSCVNGLGLSFFSNIEIRLDDTSLYGSTATNMHYKNILETLLSYDASARTTHLKSTIFELDEAGKVNTMGEENDGYKKRRDRVANTTYKDFDFTTPISGDFLRSDNHLSSGTRLTITLTKASDSFLLLSPRKIDIVKPAEGTGASATPATTKRIDSPPYKIKIKDMKLYFNRIKITPDAHAALIKHKPMYMNTKTVMKTYPLAKGLTSYSFNIQNQGKLPKTLIFAQVESISYSGDYHSNPYDFQHFNINKLNLRINGKSIPSDGLHPNFSAGLVSREFQYLFLNSGAYRIDRGNCINYEKFKKGYTIFPFTTAPDACNGK